MTARMIWAVIGALYLFIVLGVIRDVGVVKRVLKELKEEEK